MSDYDEEEEAQPVYVAYQPMWRFSRWDIVAAAFHIAGGVAGAVSQGFSHVAQSASAHANWDRQNYDYAQAEARAEEAMEAADRNLQQILGIPVAKDREIPEAEQ